MTKKRYFSCINPSKVIHMWFFDMVCSAKLLISISTTVLRRKLTWKNQVFLKSWWKMQKNEYFLFTNDSNWPRCHFSNIICSAKLSILMSTTILQKQKIWNFQVFSIFRWKKGIFTTFCAKSTPCHLGTPIFPRTVYSPDLVEQLSQRFQTGIPNHSITSERFLI